jgi:hypothetical protein
MAPSRDPDTPTSGLTSQRSAFELRRREARSAWLRLVVYGRRAAASRSTGLVTGALRATRSQELPALRPGPDPSGVTAGCWSRTSLIAVRRRSSPSASRGPRSRNRPVKSRVLCPLELETRESVGTESNCHSTKATGLQPASLANGMPTDGGGRMAPPPVFHRLFSVTGGFGTVTIAFMLALTHDWYAEVHELAGPERIERSPAVLEAAWSP